MIESGGLQKCQNKNEVIEIFYAVSVVFVK